MARRTGFPTGAVYHQQIQPSNTSQSRPHYQRICLMVYERVPLKIGDCAITTLTSPITGSLDRIQRFCNTDPTGKYLTPIALGGLGSFLAFIAILPTKIGERLLAHHFETKIAP
jgi:hypothetical protein